MYDLIYDAAWQKQPFNVSSWLNSYADFRYGKADANIKAAWQGFLKTIYNSNKSDFQGAPESVFCARPSLNAEHARTWGGLKRNYDTKAFEQAVRQFSKSAAVYRQNENYQYDLVDLVRQVLSNKGQDLYQQMVQSYQAADQKEFKKRCYSISGPD
ncbi:alpha-N-acetylglucosaminidase C-terminal domain-containing protein [Pedobacter sp. NJ-S-72]